MLQACQQKVKFLQKLKQVIAAKQLCELGAHIGLIFLIISHVFNYISKPASCRFPSNFAICVFVTNYLLLRAVAESTDLMFFALIISKFGVSVLVVSDSSRII